MSIRRLRVFDQHHPVCAAKEREHSIDGAATPPRLRRGLTLAAARTAFLIWTALLPKEEGLAMPVWR
jgi:hypothetical protein